MMPNDPVVGGNILRRPAIQSPNFQTGVSGWTINADGTAEFQSLTARGNITATSITNTPIGSSPISNSDFHDGTIERTIITLDNSGGLILVYATTVTVVTLTTGTTWLSPANTPSTGLVECWGGAAGGVFGASGKGGAGGAAEYAAEGAYPLIPNNTYAIQIGQGGQGGTSVLFVASGTATLFDNGGVTANPGLKGAFATGGLGGQGSPNSVHFPGGNGGAGFSGVSQSDAGGGGGASGGPHGSGNNGFPGTSSGGGLGAPASTGAGAGGNGGSGVTPGANGVFPGGGGGGGGSVINGTNPTNGGAGANGKIVITFQTGRTLIAALAPSAGSDSLTNAFAAAYTGAVTAFQPGVSPTLAEVWHTLTNPAGWSGRVRYKLLAETNLVVVDIQITNAGTSGNIAIGTLPAGYRPSINISLPMFITTTATAWPNTLRFTISSAGVIGTSSLPASVTGIGGTLIFPTD